MAKLLHVKKGNFLNFALTLIASFFLVTMGWGQTVTSDKDDYAPGEIAIISGSGWIGDNYVDVHFEETPAFHAEHQHDFHGIAVDADGKWTIRYQIEDRHLGVAFDVQVVGKQTGREAYTHFTDGQLSSFSLGTQSSAIYEGTASTVSYSGAFQMSANENKDATVTVEIIDNLPDGVSYSPSSLLVSGNFTGQKFYTFNLLIATSSNTPASLSSGHTFTVKITTPHQNGETFTTTTGKLIINQPGCTAPSIATPGQPTKQDVTYGQNASFSVNATGTGVLKYQWEVSSNNGSSWSPIGGANTSTLNLENPGVAMSGNLYRVVVSGECEPVAVSTAAMLTVKPRAITITADAKSKIYGENDPALTYQVTTGSLVGTDAFTGSLSRVAGENVGSYNIDQGSVALSSNYNLSYVGAKLSVTERAITITADAKSKVYGENDPALTYQVTTGSLVGTDAFTGSLSRVAGENVGSYNIEQGSVALNTNYNLSYVGAKLSVTERAITITADAKSKIYGENDPALTYQVTTGSLVVTDAFTGSLSRVAGENVGSYNIDQGSVALSSNYNLSYVGAKLSVTERAITITADAKSKIYGENDPALTYQVTTGSLVVTDAFTGSLSRVAGENVGSYNIEQGSVALSSNYNLSYVGAKLSVTERAITITADAKSKIYGENDPALSYQVTTGSLVGTDAFTGSLSRVAGENVGSYNIEQGSVALNTNYNLSYVGAKLSVTERAITITADAKSKIYGENDPALTYQVTTGSLVGTDAFTGSLSRVAGENVGSYNIEQGSVALSSNYNLSYVGAKLSVTERAITITADAKSKIYGENDPALTYQVTTGSLVGTDAFTGSLTRVAGENVGSYNIDQGSVALSSNYNLSYVGAKLSVTERAITITADAKSKIYGENDPALTYQVTTGSLVGTDAFTGSLSRVAGENVGSYNIDQGSVALSSNYNLSYVGAKLSVTERAITITADAKSKVYGENDPALTYQVTTGSLVGTDAFTGSLSRVAGENVGSYNIEQGSVALNTNYNLSYVGAKLSVTERAITITADAKSKIYGENDPALTYQVTTGSLVVTDAFTGSLSRVAGENVGSYNIDQGSVALSSNYNLSYVGAKLSVTERAITITADAKSKIYGENDPALTYQVTTGSLVVTDAFTGSLSRVAGENVGSYNIEQGSVALSSNYNLSYVGAKLSVTERAITITADAKSKIYGENDPALSYQVTTGSLVGTDAFTGSLSRVAGENVGSYNIEQGSVALNTNYNLSYVGAKLSVTERAITITADAKSKIYGEIDPALTYQVTTGSLVGTDAFTGSLTRVAGENVGSYNIDQGSVALSSNYNLSYVGAKLSVTERAITITADAKSKYCGQEDKLTYIISSGVLVGADVFTGSLSRVAGENVGNYLIEQGTVALSNNYNLSFVSANLTIKAVTLDVTNAQSPRSMLEDVNISIKVTDGATNLSGVLVTLKVGALSYTATSSNGVAIFNLGKLAAGLYSVIAQAGGCSASEAVFLPIYDPNGGFVTGGGWIESPAGASKLFPDAVGRANFGFNAKYKTGRNNTSEVDGHTNFQFKAGDLHFSSLLHHNLSLVVSGAKATYTGEGTINGTGSYEFRLIAIDGNLVSSTESDKFRIKIWTKGNPSNVIYDNELINFSESADPTTNIAGGSIVIHKPKTSGTKQTETTAKTSTTTIAVAEEPVTVDILGSLAVAPNPVVTEAKVRFSLLEDANVTLRLFDFNGREIQNLYSGSTKANEVYEVGFQRNNLMSGVYIVKLTTDRGNSYSKQVIIE